MASKENISNNSENLGKAKWNALSTKTLLEIYSSKVCDELEFLFEETVATSQTAWAATMGVPLESPNKNTTANVARNY
jgi:hypothetical protein